MIEIIPNDVLFFRESRDFTAGQNHVGRTIEPLPHTVAGALMGALFVRDHLEILNLEISDGRIVKVSENGGNWHPGFSIEGVFFHDGTGPLFRIPMDIVETEGGIAELRPYNPIEGERAVFARGNDGSRTLRFSPLNGFTSWDFIRGYLEGRPNFDGIHAEIPYVKEERVGIALDRSRTTVRGLLYRAEFLRLLEVERRFRIAVYLSQGDEEKLMEALGKEGKLKLGGESRFAGFRFTDGKLPAAMGRSVNAGDIIRVYLATPAVGKVEELKEGITSRLGGKVRFLRLFTGRRILVTGWDMVERMPKPLKYALPAGTVLWFEAKEPLNISGKLRIGEMTWAGYGLVFMGVLG
ncbi:type III-B CRISPR module-associated protein Cmr3 [Thermococcus indicus]|uniref:Type III-B CRISPR module-associated protein Cmr3 n=1 Tax=Thermococcus indicus TaxID=2586643 RepID=A0A4Y5SNC0_9EURY|nr:type III-B CRISPR module-associated protein Cmr3 [Thermococcus indicus]QDA31652.1 type III-B CRISPR module-associated protein Cmr3 [Thermococcus indicus]